MDIRVEIIKQLIDKTGLNQKAFAEKADVPYTTLRSMLERGIGRASVDNVIKVCHALGITVDELQQMADEEDTDLSTIAAHHDGEEWTEEEHETIRKFKEFVKSQRRQQG
ncbi:LexA repressor [Paenibacillus phage PG1]|jgi:transcriptional regulator with XRE-family HTH domain|uniref:transcriptional regulator n=1 Tax=Paenibacillus phage PG1 TaxID=754053 RepID=UPI00034261D6|nr:transcriptional regulator [Paenibacillus phage PG1]AGN33745.1 LexA repressor [Paenibacillus phage PG1]